MPDLKDILARLSGITRCYALNVNIQSGEHWETSLFLLKKTKGRIEIEEKKREEVNLNAELLILSIYGKQCLIRRKASESQSIEELVPGIHPEDFLLDERPGHIALIRKNTYTALLQDLKLDGAVKAGTSLLPRPETLMNFTSDNPQWGNLMISGQEFVPTQELHQWHNNEGKSYSSYEIPAIAEASHYLLTSGKTSTLGESDRKNLMLYKAFHIGWKAAIAILLIALSINAYLFDSYSKQYDETSHQILQNDSWVKEAGNLKKEYESRKEFIESRGLNKRTINAYIIDQVCAPVPKGIRLEKVITTPFTSKNNKLSISDEGIQITGQSSKTNALSDYISELKKQDWVEKVELIDFHKDPTEDYAVFNIEVSRKHER